MPELPEVEAARRAVEENCVGKKIKRAVVADDPKVIDGVSRAQFESSIVGKTIVSARRKGKNMWLHLDSPPFPSFQFGMTGAIYIKGVAVTKYKRSAVNDADEWPSKYSKVFIELDDGLEFSFTDKRRLAKVRLLENPESVPPISELGPDALFEPMQEGEFANALSKKKIGIKALLLDQSFIAGIGNWVADEVLYQARIHPLQSAESLPREKCNDLLKSINEVIEKAVDVGADSSQYPSNWIFHSRERKPGKAIVDGKKIEFITAGGRTTAFVPELQKLSGAQAGNISGKKRAGKGEDEDDGEEKGKSMNPSTRKKLKANDNEGQDEKKKGQNNKSDALKKTKTNDNDNEGPVHASKKATNKQVKGKPLKNTKPSLNDDSDDDDDNYNVNDEPKKATKITQAKEMKTVKKGTKSSKTDAQKKKARK